MAIPENVMQFVDIHDPMEQTTHQVVESKFNKWCQEHQSEIYIFMDVYLSLIHISEPTRP